MSKGRPENLTRAGMGQPPKPNQVKITVMIDRDDKARAESVAADLGLTYAGRGNIGKLLAAIARGELEVLTLAEAEALRKAPPPTREG